MKRIKIGQIGLISLIFCIFAVAVFSSAVLALGEAPKNTAAARKVPNAPDFTLKDLNGNNITLSSFRDKKVLLVFGATWCPYCVAEIPDLNAFYAKHLDKDAKLIYVDIRESVAKVAGFVKKNAIQYTVLLDIDGKVAGQYNVSGIPATFFIDETGIIKYSGSGKPEGGFEALLK